MKEILFIGHDAGRSGAPIVLLHLMRWLKKRHPELDMDLLLLRGGVLEKSYRETAEVFVVPEHGPRAITARAVEGIRKKLAGGSRPRPPKLPPFERDYRVVLGNTVATLEHLKLFNERGTRTICWLHEMEYAITSFHTPDEFVNLSCGVDHFIAASRAVEATLRKFGVAIPAEIIYEFSETTEPAASPNEVRKKLGIDPDSFVVGGGGTIEWRKGTDLFLQVARKLSTSDPTIRFLWVGGRPDIGGEEYRRMEFDIEHLGLQDTVKLTGISGEPEKYLAAIDIFALTSREDPFPLMCLEAASFGKPIVCFADAGGMPEFVETDGGAVVPYADINGLADRIRGFHLDRAALALAGQNAREKLLSRFNAENSCQAIERLLLEGSRG